MPRSTDKNQQNGPQKAASQTQESRVSASSKPAQTRKTQKRKQPGVRPGRYLGAPFGLDKNTEKHLRELSKQKSQKHMTAGILFT